MAPQHRPPWWRRILPAHRRATEDASRELAEKELAERRRAERALVESEARLRLILREQTEFVVKWLPDGTRTFVNDSYCRYFGVTEAECLGTSFFPLILPEFKEMIRQKIASLTPEHPEQTTEHVSYTANGEERWQQWTDRGIFDEDGNLASLLSTGRDVTERKRAEEALREVASRYRAILESSVDGLIVSNDRGEVLEFNTAAENLFGYRRADVIGRRIADVLVPAHLRDQHERGLARYLSTRQGRAIGRRLELPALKADGTEVQVELTIGVVAGAEPPMFAAVARDISERRQLEERLRQAQRMEAVGRLAGGIAHDFNNLVMVIAGYSDLVLQNLPPGDPRRAMVEQIHRAGNRSAELTRQLLAFSRQQVLAPRVIDLNAVVRDVDRMLRRVIGEDIVLATSLQPQLGNVYADPGQIEQVLLNLAVNARDAMPQGGTLTISTAIDSHFVLGDKPAAPHVVLSVRDTGVGMAPDVQRRVFEPFFTTKAAGQGTGLGLSVVHGIVQQSGGHIDVDSTIGAGTTFRMFLPVIDQAPEEASVTREAVPRGSERILIVEDEGPLRSLISQGLREYGYTVLEAANGQEALALAARDQDRIRLLITDVVMPGMSGRIVAERFSALHPHARVLYLSGYTDDAVIRHGVLHEHVNFLQKPFSLDALTRKVSEVLSRNTAAS